MSRSCHKLMFCCFFFTVSERFGGINKLFFAILPVRQACECCWKKRHIQTRHLHRNISLRFEDFWTKMMLCSQMNSIFFLFFIRIYYEISVSLIQSVPVLGRRLLIQQWKFINITVSIVVVIIIIVSTISHSQYCPVCSHV